MRHSGATKKEKSTMSLTKKAPTTTEATTTTTEKIFEVIVNFDTDKICPFLEAIDKVGCEIERLTLWETHKGDPISFVKIIG
jgi:hypothetical protein